MVFCVELVQQRVPGWRPLLCRSLRATPSLVWVRCLGITGHWNSWAAKDDVGQVAWKWPRLFLRTWILCIRQTRLFETQYQLGKSDFLMQGEFYFPIDRSFRIFEATERAKRQSTGDPQSILLARFMGLSHWQRRFSEYMNKGKSATCTLAVLPFLTKLNALSLSLSWFPAVSCQPLIDNWQKRASHDYSNLPKHNLT